VKVISLTKMNTFPERQDRFAWLSFFRAPAVSSCQTLGLNPFEVALFDTQHHFVIFKHERGLLPLRYALIKSGSSFQNISVRLNAYNYPYFCLKGSIFYYFLRFSPVETFRCFRRFALRWVSRDPADLFPFYQCELCFRLYLEAISATESTFSVSTFNFFVPLRLALTDPTAPLAEKCHSAISLR
jgi:hypothetical protein